MNDLAIYQGVLYKNPNPIIGAVIAMGSNDNADRAFAVAVELLGQLGNIWLSDIGISPDFTQKTTHIYHNACVQISLTVPMSFTELKHTLKTIESHCGRKQTMDSFSLVAMDLDILAVQYQADKLAWHISQKRLPFKAHEKLGLAQIAPFLLDVNG